MVVVAADRLLVDENNHGLLSLNDQISDANKQTVRQVLKDKNPTSSLFIQKPLQILTFNLLQFIPFHLKLLMEITFDA